MLKDVEYKTTYRTYLSDPVTDFFMPSFANSNRFYRGVGYFSLSSIVDMLCLNSGLITFIRNNGKIRIITSPNFKKEDIEIIQKGIKKAIYVSNELIESEIEVELDCPTHEAMDLVANLIAMDRLEIKIAIPEGGGLYHEKIGFFFDSNGDAIYFTGSNNQTTRANTINLESLIVVKSWIDSKTIEEEYLFFNNLWNNKFQKLEVYSFPEALKNKLIQKYQKSDSINKALKNYEQENNNTTVETKIELREYQKLAISQFIANKKHLFSMATGTGKTFTAVKAIEELITLKKFLIITIVPFTALIDQWKNEFLKLGIEVTTYSSLSNDNYLESSTDYQMGNTSMVMISTYDTYFSNNSGMSTFFLNQKDIIFIADEVHNITPNYYKKLPQKAEYRLGLSATPNRYNEKETKDIHSYFLSQGVSQFKYGIKEAIDSGFLAHYNYHTFQCYLTEDETIAYKNLTKSICVLLNSKPKDYEKIKKLVTLRSLILKKAINKLERLTDIIRDDEISFKNSVVYCGQGISSDESIIDSVTKIIGKKYDIQQYVSKKSGRYRKEILDNFYADKLDSLIAIRCLDEGVDIPKLSKIVIISSDGAIRQTIQRRGRVLRKCKETGKDFADIYDFIILPFPDLPKKEGKAIVVSELRRFKEYNSLADNKENNINFITYLEDEYKITEYDYLQENKITEED